MCEVKTTPTYGGRNLSELLYRLSELLRNDKMREIRYWTDVTRLACVPSKDKNGGSRLEGSPLGHLLEDIGWADKPRMEDVRKFVDIMQMDQSAARVLEDPLIDQVFKNAIRSHHVLQMLQKLQAVGQIHETDWYKILLFEKLHGKPWSEDDGPAPGDPGRFCVIAENAKSFHPYNRKWMDTAQQAIDAASNMVREGQKSGKYPTELMVVERVATVRLGEMPVEVDHA